MAATKYIQDLAAGKRQLVATFTAQNDAVVFQPERPVAMTLQATGTFANSATMSIQGSNDGVTYAELPTAALLSAVGIKSVALADLGYAYYRVVILVGASTLSAYVTWIEQIG